MIFSIALLLLVGMLISQVSKAVHLPPLIGYLLAGFLLGPHALHLLDASILTISADIRKIALVLILMKAGLSLDFQDLRRIGRPAILLCFVPASLEMLAFLLFAPSILGLSRLESGILGAVMGAVSPAVVVPRMTFLMDEKWGTKKGIPQMIVAGASADDVYVIVLFTSLLALASGGSVQATDLLQVPIAIASGILVGVVAGQVLHLIFTHVALDGTQKLIVLLGMALMLTHLETIVQGTIPFSGLLSVMSLCMTIRSKTPEMATYQAKILGKLWGCAEIFLFALVGSMVDLHYLSQAGFWMLLMLSIGLLFRLTGTYLCTLGTKLNAKERLFCAFAESPKATVQAAIGGIPFSMGLACGNTVLTFAVLAIIITAPIGAFAIDHSYQRLLTHDTAL